jgi:chromosome segregation ATPase
MRRWTFLAGMLLILPTAGLAQSSSTDSETLRALLAEMRQLRQELRSSTVAAQRAQILIYRVQAQQNAVNRVSQRLDNERSTLSQIQSEQRSSSFTLKRLEDTRNSISESERKQAEEQLTQIKKRLEQLATVEQEIISRKMELEEELRTEQAKLAQLQDTLDRIDKALEQTARALATQ